MPVDLAVVFPRAVATGGVERVAAELLADQSTRRSTVFVGEELGVPGVEHLLAHRVRTPKALAPAAFRVVAARALRQVDAATTISFGANCPPGDVLWVQSVHRAWLERGGEIRVSSLRVPSRIRYLMARHQVLLGLERAYFERSQPRLILATSDTEVDDLERFYGVPRSITQVVPNPYHPEAFNPERRAGRAARRAEAGIGEDEIVLLMVANEWHRKGLGVLIRALGALRSPRVRLDLVGKVDPSDYATLAKEHGVADRMRWHGPTSDVGAWMSIADVFVLPTTYEPFGNVIVEALASGLPVVTSRLAGAARAVDHGRTGFLLDDPRDERELAEALEAVTADGVAETMGTWAGTSVDDYRTDAVLARVDRLVFG